MPTITIGLAQLPAELRALAVRDQRALNVANLRTLSADAQRWIQWSIRGGGMPPMFGPPRPPKGPLGYRKNRRGRGLIQKVMSRLRRALKVVGVPRARGGGAGGMPVKQPPDPCMRRPPPAYRKPVDTGDYANSWRWEVDGEGGQVYASPNPPIKAGVIEHGRRLGKGIPMGPLADWVRRKLGCKDPKKARSIAFAISKTQKEQGRPGLKVLERARPKIVEASIRNVRRELIRFANSRTRPT